MLQFKAPELEPVELTRPPSGGPLGGKSPGWNECQRPVLTPDPAGAKSEATATPPPSGSLQQRDKETPAHPVRAPREGSVHAERRAINSVRSVCVCVWQDSKVFKKQFQSKIQIKNEIKGGLDVSSKGREL